LRFVDELEELALVVLGLAGIAQDERRAKGGVGISRANDGDAL
jgi:hypothetical protein